MAGESESFPTPAEDTSEYGFERAEMYQGSLIGTVDPYERHVFLCYKSHETWPSRVEDSDSDPLPQLLASALKARKNDISVKTRLTICEGGDGLKFSDGDVLIFPEMTVCRGLTESDVDSFIEDVLVNGKPWLSGMQEELAGSYVFVCAHNKRDRRCGVCGPILIERFKEEIGSKDLKDQVFVAACSHIGGHKYAGNVITFSADPHGKIAGNWYGYVTPNDVLELLDKQIGKGEVIDRIWRGQMGAKAKEDEQVEEPKHATETNANVNDKQLSETVTEVETEDVGSCCQGVNGFLCCCAENVDKKQIKNKFSSWVGKFEQRNVLTTVAVVGAVATIAVAYGFYRRARHKNSNICYCSTKAFGNIKSGLGTVAYYESTFSRIVGPPLDQSGGSKSSKSLTLILP
ncbi:altered inheritance of mitochondria protein 32 [Striga asiatica]|uniref:Altered inheritance of mitochondria protein 32 n=1 Tax=Striga asiatica TaxID=4170 RepID=A0A5A7QRA5_STRAF|nr:altered inheritance of mitochondria protein 32 [Striga asiatica]